MTTTPTPRRIVSALVAGAAGTAYYASPDFIASRTARGWTKAAITGVLLASSVPDMLELRDELRKKRAPEHGDLEQAAGGDASAAQDERLAISPRGKVAIGGVAVVALVAAAVPIVLAEKWVYRRGEARAAAGKSFAHTRSAVVYGALTVALGLVSSSQDGERA